jgi:oligopeptide transport system substrate-binding protein
MRDPRAQRTRAPHPDARRIRGCSIKLGALAAALLLASSCGGEPADEPPEGAVLRLAVIKSAASAVPALSLTAPESILAAATQPSLVQFDESGRVVPGLAQSWHISPDGLSHIFRLREASWADGREIGAEEVVASLRRAVAARSRNPLAPYLYAIENAAEVAAGKKPATALGISAVRENVVEIRLTSPQPDLLLLLAHPLLVITPAGADPPAGGPFSRREDSGDRDPPATGRLAAPDRSTRTLDNPVMLERNAAFYDVDGVPLTQVALWATGDEQTAIRRFQAGELDVVTGASLAALGQARTITVPNAFRLEPSWGVYGYLANVAEGPLADVRVRRALSMALDRDAILGRLFAIPAMRPVPGLAPPDLARGASMQPMPYWAAWPIEARREEAQRLLQESGYGPDSPLSVRVSVPRGREHANLLQAVANEWSHLGVSVQQVVGGGTPDDPFAGGQVHLTVIERIAPSDNPLFFLAPFDCPHEHAYCNEEAAQLLERGREAASIDERQAAFARAEELMAADAPIIGLFAPVRWSLVSPRVSGWADNLPGAHPISRLDVAPARPAP